MGKAGRVAGENSPWHQENGHAGEIRGCGKRPTTLVGCSASRKLARNDAAGKLGAQHNLTALTHSAVPILPDCGTCSCAYHWPFYLASCQPQAGSGAQASFWDTPIRTSVTARYASGQRRK